MDHAAQSHLRSTLGDCWKQVVEIPKGINPDQFKPGPDKGRIRESLDIPPGSKVVLFFGALDPAHWYRRPDILIQAISNLPDLLIILLIIGD